MIKHIVMWKLIDASTAPRFKAELERCKGLVPGMREFEIATRAEGFEANHDVVLYSVFDDAAALEAYLVHPTHKQVAATLGTLRESRSVFDYSIS
ncbi:Dabb family protein [Variovorax sp. PAMC 28711]|uniref:Dabb family protein n=1 Tax=Variovorax sp. PAMC 28711 TaxID=1795631 RepID=UPI00078B6B24|nr:Dabb family protein [Variovorax sp. PAMC 28711]AMM26393.1 stress responsive protein [Variovorax sp. PAMC 28711]